MKKKSIVWSFLIVIFGLGIWNLIKPDGEYSMSERRRLQQFPEISMESIMSGKFMEDFEKYTQDQFVGRESFRTLKAVSEVYGFQKADNNGIYVADGYASALEYPLNKDSVAHASKKFQQIYESYLKDSGSKIFLSVVPDKNYYLAEKNGYPAMDYQKMFESLQVQNDYMEYVDITQLLEIEDYYRTDTHWKQECLVDVANRFITAMEGTAASGSEYQEIVISDGFHGIYAGQSALPLWPDSLTYLSNEMLQQCIVYDYENRINRPVYDMELAAGKDPYEMFLSGSISLMTIENPVGQTGKELILFRDSFGSSLAPLLMSGYDKITLVDIRYLPAGQLGKYIDFEGQDVLFLYSSLVLNNSETMK